MIQSLLEYFNPLDYKYLWLLITFSLAFIVSFSSFPAILRVAEAKHLMDEPDERSTHSSNVPTLGGIGIYMSMVVVITLIGALLDTKVLLLILGGMTFLFFLGLKDDLLILSPRKKFIGQLIVALLLIIFTDTRIVGLSGIFGVAIMPYWVSVIFTLFVYLVIINGYNLIDGVDGLAGTLGLFASACFAVIFMSLGDISIATLAVGLVGSLIPFLRLNFSKRRKLFMGDTGSMLVGFLIAFFVVRFIGQVQLLNVESFEAYAPVLALSIVFFPLLDTLRIFIVRAFIYKKSPFIADKNHLHHRFLQLGFSHGKTTLSIVAVNFAIVCMVILGKDLDIHSQLILLLVFGSLFYYAFFIYFWAKRFKYKTRRLRYRSKLIKRFS
ncbi:glycosyltransferase family 4 protein [Winogradskyella aurantiaca]|uniref:glycosyltransferase family 4 protein n=1 Tax=Winogradskyella aurantiaca TaxID=2219558 RepID=UPI000E1C49D2|nr:MraY family glycosyltransferase [Winogradskyella aurantiaca]